jgi:L-rhamnose mutarotase
MTQRSCRFGIGLSACLLLCGAVAGCAQPGGPGVQRYGSVIRLKPEKMDEYLKLHADPWPEIVARLQACHIRNYSIYLAELEKGTWYLFGYFEYTGSDFDGDMKTLAADARTQAWWKLTDPCQIRIPGTPDGEQWLSMKEVYHSD